MAESSTMIRITLAGSYTGVMGLPVCETGELLKRFGWRF